MRVEVLYGDHNGARTLAKHCDLVWAMSIGMQKQIEKTQTHLARISTEGVDIGLQPFQGRSLVEDSQIQGSAVLGYETTVQHGS